jgi:glycosyltransferase involved in cell wall biosynthesis
MANILVSGVRMDMGGTEIAQIKFMKKLLDEGHKVTLLLSQKRGPLMDRVPDGVRILTIPMKKSIFLDRMMGRIIDGRPFAFPVKCICKIFKICIGKKKFTPFLISKTGFLPGNYDLAVEFHGYGKFPTAYTAARVNASKKALLFHDASIHWLEYVVSYIDYYDKLYCVSDAVYDKLASMFPEKRDRMEVLHNFIDADEIRQKAEKKADITDFNGEFRILTIARLEYQKGIDVAIRAAEILKKRGIPIKWYVIGDGNEKKKLRMMIRLKGLGDSFILLGIRRNPYPYLKACDLFALTSRFEGYPVTLIEARALCVPILASDMPCIREQITDNVNGMLTSLDPKEIADKINEFRKNPSIGRAMRENMMGETIDFSADYSKIEALIKEAHASR